MKLLALKDGRHVARFTDPVSRRQVQKSLDRLGLSNAYKRRAWAIAKSRSLQALAATISAGGAAQGRLSVEQAQADFTAGYANENTKSTHVVPLRELRAFLAGRGAHDAQDITGPDLAAWGDHVRRPANPRKASSRNLFLAITAAWCRWCKRRGLLPRIVSDDVIADALRPQKRTRDPIHVLQPAEIRQVLRSAVAHDAAERWTIAPLVLLALLTGARYSEVADLTWAEVDVEGAALRLGSGRVKTATARTITLVESPTALALLRALRLRSGGTGRVFNVPRASAETSRRRTMSDYDAPSWTWHCLRRTCGSLLVCGGIYGMASPFMTAKRLGHSLRIAESHYLGTLRDVPGSSPTIERAGGFEAEADAVLQALGAVPHARAKVAQ